ncbi:MAG: 30S ribosomal protein S24e [archaeon]
MKLIEENKKENPLLHRKEIAIRIKNYKETPSRQQVLEKISAELGYDKKNTVIDKIDQEYGKKEAKCNIKVYESEEDKGKYSKKYKEERMEKQGEEEE